MRIVFNIALVISILWLPWYISAILLVAACFSVRGFYEAVAHGILADALYAAPAGFHGFPYLATAFALLVLLLSLALRDRLSW